MMVESGFLILWAHLAGTAQDLTVQDCPEVVLCNNFEIRYINRNSCTVIGNKCTSNINRWPRPLPHPTKAMRTLCAQALSGWLRPCGEKMAMPKSARCYNYKASSLSELWSLLPCWGSATNLLGWKREVWVS